MICKPIRADLPHPLQLTMIRVGQRSVRSWWSRQRIPCVSASTSGAEQHGAVAIHELIRAILQDEPLKMRRLAEIFRVDVAALHEIWMLCGIKEAETIRMEQLLDAARQCADRRDRRGL